MTIKTCLIDVLVNHCYTTAMLLNPSAYLFLQGTNHLLFSELLFFRIGSSFLIFFFQI